MSNNHTYFVKPYNHEYAHALAVMWNESDDEWPGTFTRGVPFTAERIIDWIDKEETLLRLVAVRQDGFVAGYGTLREEPGQEGVSCYVALLNVHPAHQGKSLARRMLNQMVDWAADNGYHRLTIGTWSGNLKSVPLYKKVGFFWTPETSVHMENYIPAVRRLPLARSFFAAVDWYQDFERELLQVEDEQRHPATGQMKVYVYRWEKDGRFLEAIFDRQGQSLTGLETNEFAVYAAVEESEPAQGLRYRLRWQITNRRAQPANVVIETSGDEGIHIEGGGRFTLVGGETRTITGAYLCTDAAPSIDLSEQRWPQPSPRIHSQVTIGEQQIELSTGVQYRPPVALSLSQKAPTLIPGQPQTVLVQLHNRLKRPLSGILQLEAGAGLETEWQTYPFSVQANDFAAAPVTLTCSQPGGTSLTITAVFEQDGQSVVTPPQKTAVLCRPLGGVAAAEAGDTVYAENDFVRLTALKKAGRAKVWNKGGHQPNAWFREEVGSPFSPHDLEPKLYDIKVVESSTGYAKLSFAVASSRFAGLQLIREVVITGSPIIQIHHRLVNQSREPITCQALSRIAFLDLDFTNGVVTMPRRERFVTGLASEYPLKYGDFPKKPDGVAEQWVAYELDNQVHGAIWSSDVAEHSMAWGNIDLVAQEQTVAPGATVWCSPIYTYYGPGTWRDVRRAWQQLVNHQEALYAAPVIDKAHTAGVYPAPVLTTAGATGAELRVDNLRDVPLNGRLTLTPPPDWTTDANTFEITDVRNGQVWQHSLQFTAEKERIGVGAGSLRLETAVTDAQYPFTIIRLGNDAPVDVYETTGQAAHPLLVVDNGRFRYDVAPQFHGGIVAWSQGEDAPNQLFTLFPQRDGTFSGFNPWLGGIMPTLRRNIEDFARWPGKFYEEPFTATPVTVPDGHGLAWRGVRVQTHPRREGFAGLRAEIEYVTLGHSPVIKLIFRVVNETAVYRPAAAGLVICLQVDGRYDNAVLHTDGVSLRRSEQHQWTWFGPWAAVENPATGRAVALISASGLRRIFCLDWGMDGVHLLLEDNLQLPPYEQHELTAYLVLVDSLAEAKQYAALPT